MGSLRGLKGSQNQSKGTETLRDPCRISIDTKLTFLNSDPGSNHTTLGNAGYIVDSQKRNRLSLSLGDSQSREVGPLVLWTLLETIGQHDGTNTIEAAYAEMVHVCRFRFFLVMGCAEFWVVNVMCNSHIVLDAVV